MINDYAISLISEALKEKLNNALANQFGIPINFTFSKPTSPPPSEPTINIMMYQALMSPTLRNNDLVKIRRADENYKGIEYQYITVPLNLHYLLSFYGKDRELESQRLMAATVGVLHLEPTITADTLNRLLSRMKERDQNSRPSKHLESKDEHLIPLYEQPVTLSWSNITADDNFKLWQALQTPCALSATYEASTAIIHCATRKEPYHAVKHGGVGPSAQPHGANPSKPHATSK